MTNFFNEIIKIVSRKELKPRIICLLLSIIVWAYIGSTKIAENTFKIPIEYKNLPDSYIITKSRKRFVTVVLKGKKEEVINIDVKNIKVLVDLSNPIIGRNIRYPIELVQNDILYGIDLTLLSRFTILNIEKKIHKKVRVIPIITGNVRNGCIRGRIRISPEKVIIDGPESIVQKITYVHTVSISIMDEANNVVKDVSIDRSNKNGININTSIIKVVIPILQKSNYYSFERKIGIKNANDKFRYILNKESVNVYIRKSDKINEFSENNIEIYIDVSSLNRDYFYKNNLDLVEKELVINTRVNKGQINIFSVVPDTVFVKMIKKGDQ